MQYQLYFKKDEGLLEIKPLKKCFLKNVSLDNTKLIEYNNCYCFGPKKEIKEKAEALRAEWISEYQFKIDKLKDSKW